MIHLFGIILATLLMTVVYFIGQRLTDPIRLPEFNGGYYTGLVAALTGFAILTIF